jgi:[acyl-carrier-protein] S-malonyltransferase
MNAFLFPGQGSQEVGMGADLFRSDPDFRALVDHASKAVGEDLERLCLRGPESRLARSRALQPLMVCVSLGYLRHLTAQGIRPDVVLGHSLGELSALAAAGVISFEQAVTLAAQRGELMEAAAAAVAGGMTAVITPDRERLLHWLAASAPSDRLVLANDNAPNQIVLSGLREALDSWAEAIAREKLGTCRRLTVPGPWHSPFLQEARRQFATLVDSVPFRVPVVPMLFNLSAETEADPARIRILITRILTQPVRWRDCMSQLKRLDARELFEIGPGRVLAGLARANGFGDQARVWTINNLRGVERAIQASFP